MPPETLVPIRVEGLDLPRHLAWAEGQEFLFPMPNTTCDIAGPAGLSSRISTNISATRLHHAFTDLKPVSSRLPFSYQWIPEWLRSFLASAIGAWQRHRHHKWARFPRWPIDLSSDFFEDCIRGHASPFASAPTPV